MDKDFEFVFIHPKKNQLTEWYANVLYPNFLLHFKWPLFFFLERLYRYFILPLKLLSYRLDVIHNLNYASYFYLDWIGGHKKIVTLYDFIPLLSQNYSAPMERSIAYLGLNLALKRCDAVISISDYSKSLCEQFWVNPNIVTVSHIGPADICYATWNLNSTASLDEFWRLSWITFLLWVSSIAPHKNLSVLVRAYSKLKVDHPGLELVLAWKKRVESEELNSALEGLQWVTFTWFIDNETLAWLYRHAKAFVFPSVEEWFGLPLLEAMAHSCPIVAANSSSIPEVVWNAGILFSPGSEDDLVEKLSHLLQDNRISDDCIARWLDRFQSFSAKQNALDVVSLYSTLLSRKR